MQRCIILMATYNGEKYIAEQIESIIAQTHQNWMLYISDDGSNDETLDIINKYIVLDKRIALVHNTSFHGAQCNFYSLLKKIKNNDVAGDFYLFADQDDIWNNDKLEIMVREFEGVDYPLLCYADMIIKGGEWDGRLLSVAINNVYVDPASTIIASQVFGCNCIMNRLLFSLVPVPEFDQNELKIFLHDSYYARWAACVGKIKFIDVPTMIYRRHKSNITDIPFGFGLKRIMNRVRHLSAHIQRTADDYSRILMFLDAIKEYPVDSKTEKLLEDTKRLIDHGGFLAATYFRRYKVNCGNAARNISRFMILLSGAYKKYLVR